MSEKDAAKVKSGSIADATGAAASVSPAAAAASAGLDPLDTTDPLLHPSTSSSFRDMDFIRQKEHLFIGEESKTKFMNKLTSDIQVYITLIYINERNAFIWEKPPWFLQKSFIEICVCI